MIQSVELIIMKRRTTETECIILELQRRCIRCMHLTSARIFIHGLNATATTTPAPCYFITLFLFNREARFERSHAYKYHFHLPTAYTYAWFYNFTSKTCRYIRIEIGMDGPCIYCFSNIVWKRKVKSFPGSF